MSRDSDRASTEPGEGRPGPQRIGTGTTRVTLCNRGTLAVLAIAMASLFWSVDVEPCSEWSRMRLIPGATGSHTWSCAVSADGTRMATTGFDGDLALWNARGGWRVEGLPGRTGYVRSASLSPDGHFLVCAGPEPGVTLYDLETRAGPRRVPLPLARVRVVAFAPDGRSIAATDTDGRIVLWDLPAGRARWRLRAPGGITTLAFAPDGRSLASGALDRLSTIILWDLETGRPGRRLRTEETGGPVVALALSRDGTLLASASGYERSVRVWDPAAGRLIGSIAGHARGTNAIAFAPDGTTLATAGNDGAVRLWEVSTGRQQAALDGRASVLCGVAFSPDGRWLVATSRDDHHLRLWEPTGIEPRPRPTVGRR